MRYQSPSYFLLIHELDHITVFHVTDAIFLSIDEFFKKKLYFNTKKYEIENLKPSQFIFC